jgi:signal transduction histidine kinase
MTISLAPPGQFADQLINRRRILILLVLYRWISLIPAVVALLLSFSDGGTNSRLVLALLVAVVLNTLISVFHSRLNRALVVRPWLMLVDMALVAALIALTGGWQTPYYLYALSPLLAAAFFFQLRGALIAATLFLPMYLAAIFVAYSFSGVSPDWLVVVTAIVGAYLIAGAFGFASDLVAGLRTARDDLANAHRDLEVIHDLTISLQSAADVNEVQERVLEAVTQELGFEKAVVALVDQEAQSLTAWIARARAGVLDGRLPHSTHVPITPEGGVASETLLMGQARIAAGAPFTTDEVVNAELGIEFGHIFPLMLREHPVGVLLVEASNGHAGAGRENAGRDFAEQEDSARFQSLEAIANQAAVSLGATMMCIDRAQRLAVQEERIRIARDIHDTVSQSLFGIVYTLDGCIKLLPSHPESVEPELRRVLKVAEETRAEIRKSILDIWPSEMTAEVFIADLRKFAGDICQADDLQYEFSVSGDFSLLSSRARRDLYRISQEAVANVAHHAVARQAQVCLEVAAGRAMLSVRDDGLGFDPEQALKREYNREHFGLRGMRERASSLGGFCEISSRPGAGTSIIVEIPL